MTVVVKKLGGSVAVLIPKSIAKDMGLADGTSLEMTTDAGAIVMRKRGRLPRQRLTDVVTAIKPSTYRRRRRELLDDPPVGKELW